MSIVFGEIAMNQITRLQFLINYLIQENKLEIELPTEQAQLFSLYRSLVNIREAKTATDKFIMIQNKMLKNEIKRKESLTQAISKNQWISGVVISPTKS